MTDQSMVYTGVGREFDLRYNTRTMSDGVRANVILKGMEGKRLTYRRTGKLAA